MSADLLRKAAKVLRSMIGAPGAGTEDFVIPGPWSMSRGPGRFEVVPELDESYDVIARTEYELEAAYIATMHPGVGLALAAVLDALATDVETLESAEGRALNDATLDMNLSAYPECMTVARLILGGAS